MTPVGPVAERDPVPERARLRRVQAVEELAAATARALCGTDGLRFRGHLLSDGHRPGAALAPHLRVDVERDDTACVRGATDGVAMQLLL